MIVELVTAGVLTLIAPVPADSILRVPLPSLLIITSTPDSAEVFVDSISVGRTPCSTYVSSDLPHSLLVLQSPPGAWYADAVRETVTAAPGDTLSRHFVFRPLPLIGALAPLATSEALDVTGASLLYPPRWRLYLTGGGALLTGAAAAYLKGKADDRHAEFLATRDPAAAASRDKFDRTSTIFLIAAEVSFGLFLAFLLSE